MRRINEKNRNIKQLNLDLLLLTEFIVENTKILNQYSSDWQRLLKINLGSFTTKNIIFEREVE